MRMTKLTKTFFAPVLAGLTGLTGTGALAQEVNQELELVGIPVDGAIGFQPAVTELARDVIWLDNWLLGLSAAIVAFVTLLMIYIFVRYNRRVNPEPRTFTHHSPLEVAWTIIPVVILVFLGALSLPILFKQQEIPEGELIIKVTGNQWYWSYEYVDDDVAFDSYMIGANMGNLNPEISALLAEAGYSDAEFLLATDTAMVVPVNTVVVVNVTASDVIHAWAIPAFGVKQDGVPGRTAQLWFNAEREGVYFGQCSELCGKDHSYMPITVKVVSQETYDAWLVQAKEENQAG